MQGLCQPGFTRVHKRQADTELQLTAGLAEATELLNLGCVAAEDQQIKMGRRAFVVLLMGVFNLPVLLAATGVLDLYLRNSQLDPNQRRVANNIVVRTATL